MMIIAVRKLWTIVVFLAVARAVPVVREASFIGQGTNELASALLEGHLSRNENLVFSPLGYNAVLAIFGEGARGATREEIAAALHFPSDPQAVRLAYQSTLKRLSTRNQPNVPEMRNWFYIYKNYTVDDELKQILGEFYLTDVKSVDRPQDFLEKQESKISVPSGLQGKPTDHLIDVDKEVEAIIDAASTPHKSDGEEATSSKQPAVFDSPKDDEKPDSEKKDVKTEPKPDMNEMIKEEEPKPENNEVVKSEEPKVEHTVVPEKLPGSGNTGEKIQLSANDQLKLQEEENKPAVSEETVQATVQEITVANEEAVPEKEMVEVVKAEAVVKPVEISQPVAQDNDKEEIMVAMQRSINSVDDMSGMTDSAVKVKGKDRESQMIVFNGLYFRGDWDTQFVKLAADDSKPFYKSNNEKVFVKTLHAEGLFRIADLPDLSARAIELKYEGGRYSLLIVIPREVDGLEKLISDFSNYPVSNICEHLTEKLLDVCLPTFEITTISHPVSALKKIGFANVQSVFDPERADLSGITSQPGLFVEELVQFVTFQVDSNYTETNFLTASLASSRSDLERFQINHSFLFYLIDTVDDIIIVNGKVVDPTPPTDDFRSNLRPLV